MEADDGRHASRTPDSSGLNSTNQLHESSASDASLTSGATCGLGTAEASSAFGGPSSAAEAGQVLIAPDLDIDDMSHEELLEIGERIGIVNPEVREEAIRSQLKRRKYSRSKIGSPADTGTCCICLEDHADDDDDVGKLDCGHGYHVACIKKWLSKKNS